MDSLFFTVGYPFNLHDPWMSSEKPGKNSQHRGNRVNNFHWYLGVAPKFFDELCIPGLCEMGVRSQLDVSQISIFSTASLIQTIPRNQSSDVSVSNTASEVAIRCEEVGIP